MDREESAFGASCSLGWAVSNAVVEKCMYSAFLKKIYSFIFGQRGRGREREGDKNIDVGGKHRLVNSPTAPTGELACNLGVCPD